MLYIPFPYKRCTRCWRYLPDTRTFFRLSRYGKTTTPCKRCCSIRQSAYRLKHIDEYKLKERDYARKRRREYPEHMREIDRRRIRKPRDPEKERLSKQRYRATHFAKEAAYTREWSQRNPDKVRALAHRRRARQRQLPSNFTAADERRALDYFEGRCAVCGRLPGFWHKIAMDHWIPLSDPRPNNPGSVPWNMIPLCHSQIGGERGCNNTKWNKDPVKWIESKLGKVKARKIIARIEQYFAWIKEQD